MKRSVRPRRTRSGLAVLAVAAGTLAATMATARAGDPDPARITLPSGISVLVTPQGVVEDPAGSGDVRFGIFVPNRVGAAPGGAASALVPSPNPTRDRLIAHNLVAGGFVDDAMGVFEAASAVRGVGVQLGYARSGFHVGLSASHAEGTAETDRPGSRAGFGDLLANPLNPPLFAPDPGRGGASVQRSEAQVSLGYDVNLGAFRLGSYGALAVGRAQAGDHVDRRFSAARDDGAITYGLDDVTARSLRTSLGVSAGYALPTSLGVVLPQVRLGWERELRDDTRKPRADGTALAIETESDRHALNLGFSVGTFMTNGLAGFVDFEVLLGQAANVDGSAFTFGLRKQF